MREDLYIYDILTDIYKGECYGERALNRSRANAFVTISGNRNTDNG